jgi:hypothetical protein
MTDTTSQTLSPSACVGGGKLWLCEEIKPNDWRLSCGDDSPVVFMRSRNRGSVLALAAFLAGTRERPYWCSTLKRWTPLYASTLGDVSVCVVGPMIDAEHEDKSPLAVGNRSELMARIMGEVSA